jgi:hypothetical protein
MVERRGDSPREKEVHTKQVRNEDIGLYSHCAQLMSARGFEQTRFRFDTQTSMGSVNLSMEGRDSKFVAHIMEFVNRQREALGLDHEQTSSLVSAAVELSGFVRREDARANNF